MPPHFDPVGQLHHQVGRLHQHELARDRFTGTNRDHRALVWLRDALDALARTAREAGLARPTAGELFAAAEDREPDFVDRFVAEFLVRLWWRGPPDAQAVGLIAAYCAQPRRGRRPGGAALQPTRPEIFHALAVRLGLWNQRQGAEDLSRTIRRTRARLRETGIVP